MATSSISAGKTEYAPFYTTIRFKLTFIYSSILYLFSSILVFSFNLIINDYLKRDPSKSDTGIIRIIPFSGPEFTDNFADLKRDEQLRIKQIRLNDLRQIQALSVISLIPLAVGSFFIGYYISGKFLSPISKLRNRIEELESKDLGLQLSNNSDDEVGALIRSFNNLSSRLQESFQSQEQFVQNASHEIRTPLTIIQTNIDTVLDDSKATNDELRTAMRNSLGGVKQLRKLVNYLLELTISHHEDFKPILLNETIKAQISALSDLAKEKQLELTVSLDATDKVQVEADEALLGRVFYNLIENGIKYSALENKKGHCVDVTTATNAGIATISITNCTEAIPPEKLNKLFDRFYQVDPSRSKKLGGYGLGLSIVKKIVTEHGGKVTATSVADKTTFTVELPYKPTKYV